MIVIISDNKRGSGKTTVAKEFLKDKNYLTINSIGELKGRFWHHRVAPEWVFMDGCSLADIDKAESMGGILNFGVQYSDLKVSFPTPNFLFILNENIL